MKRLLSRYLICFALAIIFSGSKSERPIDEISLFITHLDTALAHASDWSAFAPAVQAYKDCKSYSRTGIAEDDKTTSIVDIRNLLRTGNFNYDPNFPKDLKNIPLEQIPQRIEDISKAMQNLLFGDFFDFLLAPVHSLESDRKTFELYFVKPQKLFTELFHDANDNPRSKHYKPFHEFIIQDASDPYTRGLQACKSYKLKKHPFNKTDFEKLLNQKLSNAKVTFLTDMTVIDQQLTDLYDHVAKTKQTGDIMEKLERFFLEHKFKQYLFTDRLPADPSPSKLTNLGIMLN